MAAQQRTAQKNAAEMRTVAAVPLRRTRLASLDRAHRSGLWAIPWVKEWKP
jgi:hypothetical protein